MREDRVLDGRRVRLRPTVVADGPALVGNRSTPEVRRWWRGGDLAAEFDEELSESDVLRFTIVVGDAITGLIQFYEEPDEDYRHASIDIYVDPSRHRQGIASDAIGRLADHLFDDRPHHRLTIDPAADNAAASACYAAVGFRPVGVMRRYERRDDGAWGDGLLMDMLETDRGDPDQPNDS